MRELIDKNELDFDTVTTDDYSGNETLDIVLKEDIDDAHVFTEQEIVKPYFERLKREIDRYTDMHADGDFYIKNYDVKRMMDKILSE